MECPSCQHDNPEGQKFCGECGDALILVCPKCSSSNPPGQKYCGECGSDLSKPKDSTETKSAFAQTRSPAGERRQATIVFSDLSGYTAMNEKLDPEEVEGIMSRIKAEAVKIVERHGGIVSQFVGDEVLALFGIPTAHEDDPQRAVRAVLELHELARNMSPEVEERIGRSLRMHTGINTGLVVTSMRDVRDGTIGVTGDTVNTSARLKALAEDDQILVSPETRNLISTFFQTEALAPIEMKGKSAPVVPHRVVGATGVRTKLEAAQKRGFTPHTGRERELSTLRRALDRAMAGQGQFVTVVGEAGLGKSRLLYEFRQMMDRDQVTVLEGRCQSYGAATPYLPWLDALRRGLHLREEDSPAQRLDTALENIRAIDNSLEQYIPHYLHLLSVPSEAHPLPADLKGAELKRVFEEALAAIVTLNSEQKPMVHIMEDWHWADESSEATLHRLLGLIPSYPLMVVVIYRPEYEANWGNLAHHTPLVLTALDSQPTESMIKSLFGATELPEALTSLIYERTDGNPFFIEEMCSAFAEEGALRVMDGRAELSGSIEALRVPDSVQAVIRSRLDRLSEDAREALRLASVIGREFARRILERIHTTRQHLSSTLEDLKTLELIQQIRLLPEAEYMFNHVITQQVTYETLLLQQRRELHGLVGQAIEALYAENLEEQYETLAYHFSNSNHHEKATEFLSLAAEKAEGLYALVDARRCYNTAITLIDERQRTPALDKRRIDLSLKWAAISAYGVSEELLAALSVSRSHAQELGEELPLAKLTYWMGMTHYQLGNYGEAIPLMEESIRLGEVLDNEELQTLPNNVIGRTCVGTADFRKGIEYLEKGIPLVERIGNLEEAAYSIGILGLQYSFIGQFEKAFSLIQKALSLSREIGNKAREAHSQIYAGVSRCIQGDWEAMLEPLSEGTEIARALGNPITIGIGVGFKGIAQFHLGQREEGLARMAEGIDTIESSGSRQVSLLIASYLAECHALEGHQAEAMNLAQKVLEGSITGGERWGMFGAYRALALASGLEDPPDWAAGEEHTSAGLALARESGARPLEALAHLRHSGLLQQKGDLEKAGKTLRKATAAFRKMGMKGWLEQAEKLGKALSAN